MKERISLPKRIVAGANFVVVCGVELWAKMKSNSFSPVFSFSMCCNYGFIQRLIYDFNWCIALGPYFCTVSNFNIVLSQIGFKFISTKRGPLSVTISSQYPWRANIASSCDSTLENEVPFLKMSASI